MEDQSLFTTCIQKHIAHQTTKIKKFKKKEKGKKGGGGRKNSLLKTNMQFIQNKPSGN